MSEGKTVVDTAITPGAEQARLYRDRLRGKGSERVQLEARRLAGDPDVSDEQIKKLDEQIAALEKAAKDAEAADRGGS